MPLTYYAHRKAGTDESQWQILRDHLYATAELARALAPSAAGLSELAYLAGLFHDLGKYSTAFQERLRGAPRRVDHSTAGGREIVRSFSDPSEHFLAELLSFCILGHHAGLPNYGSPADVGDEGTLIARRDKACIEDYSAYRQELDVSQLHMPKTFQLHVHRCHPGFSISFLIRMIFSALTDADWLDTERFMQEGGRLRASQGDLNALAEQFFAYLRRFENPQSLINTKRTETLEACIQVAGSASPGLFTLTVPTGGGKTLSSMAFALRHALANNLKRIIYVIPFTTIIEQNAGVFREALGPLGPANVLEHHSNFDWEQLRLAGDEEDVDTATILKQAAENWDIPIVVTTNVQFFESLFSDQKSRARRLHNIADSVVIFDEVQVLPLHYLSPCMTVVEELVRNYGVTAVFCTATQPSLGRFFSSDLPFREIAPDPPALYEFFRRVDVQNLGEVDDDELLRRLNAHPQTLCIVNTRRHAKGLFEGLAPKARFHLSTLMCPAHRRQTLAAVQARLRAGKPCRLVSTQVMEAGIDIDFPVGYRALAGLDSIIQAAGRINREGMRSTGTLFVFSPQTPFIKRTPVFIEQTAAVAGMVLRDYPDDPICLDAIAAYYNVLYSLHDERAFDAKGIMGYLDKGNSRINFEFRTAGERFKLIDDDTVSIIIPYDETAKSLVDNLRTSIYPLPIVRRVQSYTVNVYVQEFEALQSLGILETIDDRFHVLSESYVREFYHPQTGLVLPESDSGAHAVFFD